MIDILIFGFGLVVVILVGTALGILITTNNRAELQHDSARDASGKAI